MQINDIKQSAFPCALYISNSANHIHTPKNKKQQRLHNIHNKCIWPNKIFVHAHLLQSVMH